MASFDCRVAGSRTRVLFDTGATCSCISHRFLKKLGMIWTRASDSEPLRGVGGQAPILGNVRCLVKIGKLQIDHTFLVVQDGIAGYEALLGEDFMKNQQCSVFYHEATVNLSINCNAKGEGTVVFSRKLEDNELSTVRSTERGAFPILVNAAVQKTDELDEPEFVSLSERKKLLHEVATGQSVAYRLIIQANQTAAAVTEEPIPGQVQAVIQKHSAKGETLAGTIPDNTHAKGYECDIELIPGVNPVVIRQYRLTPREKEELLDKVDAFVK